MRHRYKKKTSNPTHNHGIKVSFGKSSSIQIKKNNFWIKDKFGIIAFLILKIRLNNENQNKAKMI